MTIARTSERSPRKPLRLWPGVVAVVLLLVARFGVKAVVPGFRGFALGMQWALGAALAVVLWWVFFSRARWLDRVGAIVLMIVGPAATWYFRHESMGPAWFFAYVVPTLCLALVAGAAAGRRLRDGPRRATIAAAILLACGVWTLVRTEGISGDHVVKFDWRWTKSPEERLLAEAGREPAASAQGGPTALPPAPSATEVPKAAAAAKADDKSIDSAPGKPVALPNVATAKTEPATPAAVVNTSRMARLSRTRARRHQPRRSDRNQLVCPAARRAVAPADRTGLVVLRGPRGPPLYPGAAR